MKGRFELSGGRAGVVHDADDGRRGGLSWEMLVGEFSMVVHAEGCRWVLPEEREMTPDEARELTQKLAADMKINVELALSTGTELVRWRDVT